MSTFKFAGVSTLDGVTKFRVANDSTRVKVLAKNGHKDIDIIELKDPMTKEEAVAFLIKIDFDNGNATVRAALEAELDKRTEKPAKEPKVPKVKAEKPTMEAIKARVKKEKAIVVDPGMEALTAGMNAMTAKPKSTLSKKEILKQLEDKTLDEAPF